MSAEIVELDVVTKLDIPPERILRRAHEASLDHVMVIGFDSDGDFYFAASYAAGPECLWLLELARKKLMEIGDPQ